MFNCRRLEGCQNVCARGDEAEENAATRHARLRLEFPSKLSKNRMRSKDRPGEFQKENKVPKNVPFRR
jgi:hypothetical protein